MKDKISIRDIVKSMNLTTRTLRYYEELGLIKSLQEGRGNRVYDKEAIGRIVYLNELKNKGFSLKEIEGLLGNQCCNQKTKLLKNRIEENNKMIEFLNWQNEKIQEEMDIIDKLDMVNIYLEIEKIPEEIYSSKEEQHKVEEDPDVEKIWNLESYDIKEERVFVFPLNQCNFKEENLHYSLTLKKDINGTYVIPEGKYLVAYSREGLHRQREIFEKMLKYLEDNNLQGTSDIYVENKFRIFCKRERKVVTISKNYIKISKKDY
ncbi:MerR family transcriptional regulator [Cetobacterium sp. SF1]|uniref:helix-turn-helix domain-containing protein n=1 Tax=Cetobacterium sp. SF1 TaxID=3417654 RepID=UPI003CF181B3